MSVGALYVHVPFCVRKCAYCDFASWQTPRDDALMVRYVRGIVEQLEVLRERGFLDGCQSAYVGGGTPSMLGPDLLSQLLRALPKVRELTCEANPDSLDDEALGALVAGGVTRVSIGVQSLQDAELASLGRLHTAAQATDRVRAAVATGLDVSVDLMCAIPHQSDASWDATLAGVLDLGVGHVSVYPLAIEEGTPLCERYAHQDAPFNDEDVQAARMERAEQVLTERGYVRYEVASYALPGKACAHNIAYWTGVPYLGVGTRAASMLDRKMYEHLRASCPRLPDVEGDTARVRLVTLNTPWQIAKDFRLASLRADVEQLNARQAWAEDLMLGMRMTSGVELERVPTDVATALEGRGLVTRTGGRLVPTHDGWLLGNELYGALWDLAG